MIYNLKIKIKQKFGEGSLPIKIIDGIYGEIKKTIPLRFRYGKEYRLMLNFLNESQYWTKEKLEEYQYDKMSQLLNHAENYVLWYKKKFAEWGVNVKDFVNLGDIRKFPVVTKEEIRDNLDQFLDIRINKNSLMYVTTGGSTGIPFAFYQPSSLEKIDYAFFSHHWGWLDCKLSDLSVVLRGEYVGSEKKLFYFKPSKNEWHFSTYFLTEENVRIYINKLNEIKPKFLQAYPSAVEILAKYLLDQNLKMDFKLAAIMCGSENVYSDQVEIIEKAFHTHVHCWYGQAERVCLAPWTKNSRYYHVYPQYGLTELLSDKGEEVTSEDEIGEIIATGFHNLVMPLIRYKTRDLALHTNKKSPDGINFRLFSRIEGRLQELIVTSSGRLISMTAINMHDNTFDNVKQFQFFQNEPGILILRVIPNSNFGETDKNRIIDHIKNKIGKDTELILELVQSIEKTKSGKLRFLIQHLPINRWESLERIT
ncbi:MAG: phenylacetate--CoA ligase family protein [Ignavibacteria bacterium]|nr:phenylacetate--CoA ligase family protein [Ignavibacteria bacterium]